MSLDPRLKVGAVVMVYEDPITKNREEGLARILEVLSERTEDDAARLRVRFLSDGAEVERFIW